MLWHYLIDYLQMWILLLLLLLSLCLLRLSPIYHRPRRWFIQHKRYRLCRLLLLGLLSGSIAQLLCFLWRARLRYVVDVVEVDYLLLDGTSLCTLDVLDVHIPVRSVYVGVLCLRLLLLLNVWHARVFGGRQDVPWRVGIELGHLRQRLLIGGHKRGRVRYRYCKLR
jgi:hypothetical protein